MNLRIHKSSSAHLQRTSGLWPVILCAVLLANCASPIVKASQTGGPAELQKALDEGADINGASFSGTPLYAAVAYQNKVAAQYLLDKGAKPDLEDFSSLAPPLFAAAALGNIELVDLLLSRGASPSFEKQAAVPRYWSIPGLGELPKARALGGAVEGYRHTLDEIEELSRKTSASDVEEVQTLNRRIPGYFKVMRTLAVSGKSRLEDIQSAAIKLAMIRPASMGNETRGERQKALISLLDYLTPGKWPFDLWVYLTGQLENNQAVLDYAMSRARPPVEPETKRTLWHALNQYLCSDDPTIPSPRGIFRIVARHVSVNTPDKDGRTILHTTATTVFGTAKSCTPLLVREFNANINAADRYGWTVAHYFAADPHEDVNTVLTRLRSVSSVGANLDARIQTIPPELDGQVYFTGGQGRIIRVGMTVREIAALRGIHLP